MLPLAMPAAAVILLLVLAIGCWEVWRRLRLAAATPCDLHIVLDCANGAGGVTAPEILAASGAKIITADGLTDAAQKVVAASKA
jgi:hypothetical protein